MSDPKALLATFGAKIFAEKDFTALGDLMREDYIQHNPLVGQGSIGFKDFFEAWFKASPDFKFELRQIAAEGDKVWVHGTYSGTHKGELMGIPPTGKQVEVPFIIIYKVSGGKIVDHTMVADQAGMMQQITG